jgi:hypothetical protein
MSTAFIHRDADMDLFLDVYWLTEEQRPAAQNFLETFMAMIEPMSNHQSYQNYPRRSQTDYRTRYWGPYFEILALIKRKYDPAGFFRFQQNVDPKPLPGQLPVTTVFPGGLPPNIIYL